MKESENHCLQNKSKLLLFFKGILCLNKNKNLNLIDLKSKLLYLSIFYIVMILISLLNITLFLNYKIIINQLTPSNPSKFKINLKEISGHGVLTIEKIKQDTKNRIKLKRMLNSSNNFTEVNISLNEDKYSQKSIDNNLIGILYLIFFIKIFVTLVFVIFYYNKYRKVFSLYNKRYFKNKCNFTEVNINQEKNCVLERNNNRKIKSNIKSKKEKISVFPKTCNKSNKKFSDDLNLNNNESQNKLKFKQNLINSKIKLIESISFFNTFDITFQFFIFVSWLKNFYFEIITNDQFCLFYLALFYFSIFCIYFGFLDTNNRYFFFAHLINTLLIGIFEIEEFINILFFKNFIFLTLFWIMFYLIIKNKKNKEENSKINQKNQVYNEENEIEDNFVNYGHLIVNLIEDKSEIINKKFKESVLPKFKNDFLEKISNMTKPINTKNFISNSNKNDEKLTKENKKTKIELSNIKNENKISSFDKSPSYKTNFNLRQKNKKSSTNYNSNNLINENSKFEINLKKDLKSKLCPYEKINYDWKMRFISNNLTFFTLLIQINDFNFNLSEELIDCYIKIRKNLCFTKENKISFNNFSKTLFKYNKKNKIDSENFIKERVLKNLIKFNQNESDYPLNISNNNLEIEEKAKEDKNSEINYSHNIRDNRKSENLNKNYEETSLLEELFKFCELLTQEAINSNQSLFLGNIKMVSEKSDNNTNLFAIRIDITENQNFIVLTFNNNNDEVRFVEKKTEFNFLNLYLKKFCHEFKNPLINILQLTKNFTQSFKTFKVNVSSFSNNNQTSRGGSNSNFSNNLKDRRSLFKSSTKNFSDKKYNKSTNRKLSIVGEELFSLNVKDINRIDYLSESLENQSDSKYIKFDINKNKDSNSINLFMDKISILKKK